MRRYVVAAVVAAVLTTGVVAAQQRVITIEDVSSTVVTSLVAMATDIADMADSLADIASSLAQEAVHDSQAIATGPQLMGECDAVSTDAVDENDAGRLRVDCTTRALLTTTTLGANSGVDIGDVTLTANNGVDIGDVTLTAGSASIGTLGANSGVDIGDVTLTAGSALVGNVGLNAVTTGGADGLKYTSAGSTEDEHAVKASAGTLYSITVTNTNAAARYLRCENDTAANTTPGSETVELDLAIPGATAGAGFTTTFPMGYSFSTALTCWLVTGAADTDVAEVAANEIKVFYTFK